MDEWVLLNDSMNKDKESVCLTVRHKELPIKAYIKWDGCCQIYKYDMDDFSDEPDTIHICDVPAFIEVLKSLEKFRLNNIEGVL